MIFPAKPTDFNKRLDVVGCFLQSGGEFVLLHRLAHKAHGNTWGLPAGKVDAGESLEQAVLREVEEETGLKLSAASVHYHSSLYVRDDAIDLEWHMFSATFATKPSITINPREHSEFRWVTPEEALQMEDPIHDLRQCIELFYR